MRASLVALAVALLVLAGCGTSSKDLAKNEQGTVASTSEQASTASTTQSATTTKTKKSKKKSSPSPPPPPTTTEAAGYSEDDVAYKLAVIDKAIELGDLTNPAIDKYANALDKLRKKCRESRTKLSDEAVRSTQVLKQDTGRTVTTLTMLKAANKSIPNSFPGKTNCGQILAAVIVLMEG